MRFAHRPIHSVLLAVAFATATANGTPASAVDDPPYDVVVNVQTGLGDTVDAKVKRELEAKLGALLAGVKSNIVQDRETPGAPYRFTFDYRLRGSVGAITTKSVGEGEKRYIDIKLPIAFTGQARVVMLKREGDEYKTVKQWQPDPDYKIDSSLGRANPKMKQNADEWREKAKDRTTDTFVRVLGDRSLEAIEESLFPMQFTSIRLSKKGEVTGVAQMFNRSPWPVTRVGTITAKPKSGARAKPDTVLLFTISAVALPDHRIEPNKAVKVDFKTTAVPALKENRRSGNITNIGIRDFSFSLTRSTIKWAPKEAAEKESGERDPGR